MSWINGSALARGIGMSLAFAAVALCGVGCDESGGANTSPGPIDNGARLIIVTPHNDTIRAAFSEGFTRWYQKNRQRTVTIEWVARGTPQCVEYIERAIQSGAEEFRAPIPDLMFGGGVADHRLLAERGYSTKVDLGPALEGIPAELAGLPTRDPGGRWYGTGLSSFGIVYNARACAERGIQPPQTWADLADPRFAGWVGLADPAASGSNRECMLIILQHLGWDRGWPTLMQILANANALNRRSADVLTGIQTGVFLAAFAVNFDGMRLAAESGNELVYVNPAGATAISPDVTSVLNARRPDETARDFVRFLLSDDGQLLWAGKPQIERGNEPALYHYPIAPRIYRDHPEHLCVSENPFETDFGVKFDLPRTEALGALLPPLVKAAAGPSHIRLQQAWAKARATADVSAAALFKPPIDEGRALELGRTLAGADASAVQQVIDGLAGEFRARYEAILSAGTQ